MQENIKVMVRVRNANEGQVKSPYSVSKASNSSNSIYLRHDNDSRLYTFNDILWSADGYKVNEKGNYIAQKENYATQEFTFNKIKEDIHKCLDNSFNYCLFAYGQTGSGKTFTILGNQENPGILPRFMDLIIEYTRNIIGFSIKVSMYEIYNDKIFDLLNDRRDLGGRINVIDSKVRGLKEETIIIREQMTILLKKGIKNRTSSRTNMNDLSSRSHMNFVCTVMINNKKSIFQFIDLAGSERNSKAGSEGKGLEEANYINLSLLHLSSVIRDVGKSGKSLKFNNSTLTKILKNSIGGSSKTTVIVNISPIVYNYSETKSTLCFADELLKIKNTVECNFDEFDNDPNKLRKLLDNINIIKKENEQYKKEKQQYFEFEAQLKKKIILLEEELDKEKNQLFIKTDQKNPKIYLIANNKNTKKSYKLSSKINIITSSKETDFLPDDTKLITIESSEIMINHCQFIKIEENYLVIEPLNKNTVYLNGKLITKRNVLASYDRIIIGEGNFFIFKYPKDKIDLIKNYKFITFLEEKYPIKGRLFELFNEDEKLRYNYLQILNKVNIANSQSIRLNDQIEFNKELIIHPKTNQILVEGILMGKEFRWDSNTFNKEIKKYKYNIKFCEEKTFQNCFNESKKEIIDISNYFKNILNLKNEWNKKQEFYYDSLMNIEQKKFEIEELIEKENDQQKKEILEKMNIELNSEILINSNAEKKSNQILRKIDKIIKNFLNQEGSYQDLLKENEKINKILNEKQNCECKEPTNELKFKNIAENLNYCEEAMNICLQVVESFSNIKGIEYSEEIYEKNGNVSMNAKKLQSKIITSKQKNS